MCLWFVPMINKETSSDMIKEPFTIMGESAKKNTFGQFNIYVVKYLLAHKRRMVRLAHDGYH